MIKNYLGQQIKANFSYKPTLEQENAIKKLAQFLFSPQNDEVFLLKGYAGTGKTSLVGALVKTLYQLEQKCVLLAPTGRAAKVFSHYAVIRLTRFIRKYTGNVAFPMKRIIFQ